MVHFEADTERRKLGLPHRVSFLGHSSLEPEYTQTEEVELHRQHTAACTTATFQLHVSYTHDRAANIRIFSFLFSLKKFGRKDDHNPVSFYSTDFEIISFLLYILDFSPNSLFFLFFFKPLLLQEGIRDKLRPISLAITHTIKSVPPRRHSGSKRLEKLAPVLNVSPSNTIPYEVWSEKQTKQKNKTRDFLTGLVSMGGA